MGIIEILVGIAVLIFGRKLFWLFVACIGFVVGMEFGAHMFPGQSQWAILAVAVLAGLVGALVAVFLQKLAILLSGFSIGLYLSLALITVMGWHGVWLSWFPLIIGGVVGAVLLYFLFDWALIFLSSLAGATLVTQSLHLSRETQGFLFMALFAAGIVIQVAIMRGEQRDIRRVDHV